MTHDDDEHDAYIEAIVAAAPPLTDEQRQRLCELMRPARQMAGAA